MESTQKILIYDALNTLEPKEQSIVKLYYLAGFSEEDIASSYHISIPRVNQIKKRALAKCKLQLEKKLKCVSIV
jgi:RNA polymerase sigma factor (sigma-70 family)